MDQRRRLMIATVAALWIALAAMPTPPIPSSPGLDGSWILGLSMAHAQGLVHGRDIIWTFGPMGYLSMPDPASSPRNQVLVYHLGLYLLWVAALFRLARSVNNQAAIWSAILLGIVGIGDVLSPDRLELAFFTIAALSLLDVAYRRVELVILAFLAAVGLLVKVNLGVEFAVTFACLLAFAFWDWRPVWKPLAIFAFLPGFTFALYWIFTGSPGTFFSYLRYAGEIAAGYSNSMSMAGSLPQAIIAVASLLILFLGLPFLANNIRELRVAFVPAAASAFFAFKTAMVRQDAHAATLGVKLALVSVFFLVTVKSVRYRRALMALQVAWLVASYVWISQSWGQAGGQMARRLLLLQAGPSMRAFLDWPNTWYVLQQASEVALSKAQLDSSFAAAIGRGTVDALPWDVGQVKANHWLWRPRPVFQSYAAYTPALDQVNAEHTESPQAADFLLLNWIDIDGRHPFFTDPLSWRALLRNYRSGITDGSTLLMQHVATPRFDRLDALSSSTTHWNVDIPVPQGQAPLLLSAAVRKSLYGAARSMVYRLTPVWIDIVRQSGRSQRYRAVPANLANGVIVDPLPESLADLNLLGQPGCTSQQDPVVILRLSTNRPSEFHDEIPLTWSHRSTGSTGEKAGPCAVVEISRREFPSWGGIAELTLTTGKGPSEAPALRGVADWLQTTPVQNRHMVLSASVNTGSEPRRSSISAGGYPTTIVQAGTPQGAVSDTVQLGVFGSGRDDAAPAIDADAVRSRLTVLRDRITDFNSQQGQPVMGDWTGSGVVRLGMFRDGYWYLDLNNNRKWDGVEGGDGLFKFGLPGDFATVGDWKGDGITRLGVFRKGEWVLDVNNNRSFDKGDVFCYFGLTGDIPVVGKWTPGSKADQIGVFRKGIWIIDNIGDHAYRKTDTAFQFGLPGDIPVVSRSRGRVGVYRNGTWFLDFNGSRQYDPKAPSVKYGLPGDRPLIAEW